VVAQEVRELAGRSANAAKPLPALLITSLGLHNIVRPVWLQRCGSVAVKPVEVGRQTFGAPQSQNDVAAEADRAAGVIGELVEGAAGAGPADTGPAPGLIGDEAWRRSSPFQRRCRACASS
jgi:hypothetical protein